MRISYDEQSRGLLISFGDPSRYRESREIADGVVVDFDENGKVLAVELEDLAGFSVETAFQASRGKAQRG
jgi:Protein of unknown function (DUF2283).